MVRIASLARRAMIFAATVSLSVAVALSAGMAHEPAVASCEAELSSPARTFTWEAAVGGPTHTMLTTGYCACKSCCGSKARGITASGKRVQVGMCAADPSIPYGKSFHVPGYGRAVVEDRGSAVRGAHIDLFFASHQAARQWGRQRVKVRVLDE